MNEIKLVTKNTPKAHFLPIISLTAKTIAPVIIGITYIIDGIMFVSSIITTDNADTMPLIVVYLVFFMLVI